jgi:hypothetical protein
MSEDFDSHFIQIIDKDAAGVATASTIRTSRKIVLTQKGKTELGKTVHVATTANLTVYGDVVCIDGMIQAPGRRIKIVCRQLEFHSLIGASGLDVSGEKGKDGDEHSQLQAKPGDDGKDSDRAGLTGTTGKNGADGKTGAPGGDIEIYCGTLLRYSPVYLTARGGPGGNGKVGQQGGRGGNGFTNYLGNEGRGGIWPTTYCLPEGNNPFKPCEFSAPCHGGEGGGGGNGGNGGAGGKGGKISLLFMRRDNDPEGRKNVAFSVTGGNGGDGGRGGEGGAGGNGGTARNYQRHLGPAHFHYVDGADAGGGGIHGLPGYAGPAGSSGEITLVKSDHVYAPLEGVNLPQPPPRAPMLDGPRPDPMPDLPENLTRRERDAAIARAQSQARLYRETLAAYNQAKQQWTNECDRLKRSVPYFPDLQRPGHDGDFPTNLDECSSPGTPGNPAEPLEIDQTRPQSWNYRRGKVGDRRQPNKARNEKSRPAEIAPGEPGHPTKLQFREITYKDLADQADFDQSEMLLDHVRVSYLLANVFSPNFSRDPLQEVLGWLFELADCRAAKPLLGASLAAPVPSATPAAAAPGLVKPVAEGDVWAQLRATASATRENLEWGFNIFGQDETFADLGDMESYKKDVTKMLALYAPVEQAYQRLQADLTSGQEREAYLSNVVLQQTALIDGLNLALEGAKENLKHTLKEIQELDASRNHAADSFIAAIGSLEAEIGHALGITPADIFNALTQLSFTNTHFFTEKGGLIPTAPLAAGAMVASQIGDLATKAAENVVTDTGGSINKHLVIRRMEYLSRDIKTMAALKETRDGLIKADPNAEYRLLTTRDQVEQICSNFYTSYPDAKKASEYLDGYIEAVAARNAKVDEYNYLLSGLTYIASELLRTRAQKQLTEATRLGAANPGLPAMAKFRRALRRHAWENCVEILYLASRVYTLKSLDPYDVFSHVLGKLASGFDPAELDSAALNVGLIDLMSADLKDRLNKKTNSQSFGQTDEPCSIILSSGPVSLIRPDLIKLLKDGKPAKLNFSRMTGVRLTHLRCTPAGINSDDPFTFKFTHRNRVALIFAGAGSAEVSVNEDQTAAGPFRDFSIEIPRDGNKDLDLTWLETIRIHFKGERSVILTATPLILKDGLPREHEIAPGDLLLVRPDLIAQLRNGDAVTFRLDTAIELRSGHISCCPTGIQTSDGSFTVSVTLLAAAPMSVTLTGRGSAEIALDQSPILIGPFRESTIDFPRASNGELDLSELKSVLLDFNGEKLHRSIILVAKAPPPAAGPVCLVQPDVFDQLQKGKPAKFRILPAGRNATIDRNLFAGKADVRLTHIGCMPTGIKTLNKTFKIKLTHPGSETFVDENGREVYLHHNPMTVILEGTSRAKAELDKDHTMIGPFCEWIIEIPKAWNKQLDLSEFESIQFDFKGEFRAPRWVMEAEAENGAAAVSIA